VCQPPPARPLLPQAQVDISPLSALRGLKRLHLILTADLGSCSWQALVEGLTALTSLHMSAGWGCIPCINALPGARDAWGRQAGASRGVWRSTVVLHLGRAVSGRRALCCSMPVSPALTERWRAWRQAAANVWQLDPSQHRLRRRHNPLQATARHCSR